MNMGRILILIFLSTPSARRATDGPCIGGTDAYISIHALREEGDRRTRYRQRYRRRFLSTPSARRATLLFLRSASLTHISIHALREEGDRHPLKQVTGLQIFLSTPSARRATVNRICRNGYTTISIHALREEGDRWRAASPFTFLSFLSTPSARRATRPHVPCHCIRGHFYPRPPRGGRPRTTAHPFSPARISIHALREEGDSRQRSPSPSSSSFLSTPSARRATHYVVYIVSGAKNFYPRPPRGGRQKLGQVLLEPDLFLSTPSARRATPSSAAACKVLVNFYPRPPRGGRRCDAAGAGQQRDFYPRPPRGGRPAGFRVCRFSFCTFLSTPTKTTPKSLQNFYPRPPRGGRLCHF